ncbi:MAG: hypothetical protein PHI40_01675 [Caldisericia bacterium]|nr:hypothetical protein [Caldisericia bacterium]MDD4614104.1 hypothetical protein [Caldisericia bacterium]
MQTISNHQFRTELQNFVYHIFDMLGEKPYVQVYNEPFGLLVEVDIQDPSRYIGIQGEGLGLIQHLVKTCFGSKYNPLPQFMVDIGEYKRKQISILKNIAVSNAIKVRKTGKSVELSPMSPFARRIIHLTLKDHPHCTTHSIGEGEQRRIVINLKG